MKKVALSFVLASFLLDLSRGARLRDKLPATWKRCKKNDPSTNKCLTEAIEGAILDLVDGDTSFGVLPLDPLRFNHLEVNQGSGPVAINLTFFDIDQHGFKSLKMKSVKSNLDNGRLDFEMSLSQPMETLGKYKINGRVLVLPIQGEGNCNLTFADPGGTFSMRMKEIEKAGKRYFEVTNMNLNMTTSRLFLKFEGLFNGDKALGDNMNLFLNENWKEILEEVMPGISKGFGEGYKQIANRLLSKVPITNIFF